MSFEFLDPGPLVDRELQLVAPAHEWIDDVLASIKHPLTIRHAPAEAEMTREKLLEFIARSPRGQQAAIAAKAFVPAYHFWMRITDGSAAIKMAGGIGLRIGGTPEIELYSGNIGYHVYPPARGRHYAERACRLIFPLAKRHGMSMLWITCNPDNTASRRTCERLGATLIDIVPIPPEHPFRIRGETAKCRFFVDLDRV
jgi:tagatose 1,6-diphosphate aldolase